MFDLRKNWAEGGFCFVLFCFPLQMGISFTLNIFAHKSNLLWYLYLAVDNLMQQIHCRACVGCCCSKRVKLTALSNSDSAEKSWSVQEKEYVIEYRGYVDLYYCFWLVMKRKFFLLVFCLLWLTKHANKPRVFIQNSKLQAAWKGESSIVSKGRKYVLTI